MSFEIPEFFRPFTPNEVTEWHTHASLTPLGVPADTYDVFQPYESGVISPGGCGAQDPFAF